MKPYLERTTYTTLDGETFYSKEELEAYVNGERLDEIANEIEFYDKYGNSLTLEMVALTSRDVIYIHKVRFITERAGEVLDRFFQSKHLWPMIRFDEPGTWTCDKWPYAWRKES